MVWWFFGKASEERRANVSYTAARGERQQPRPDEPLPSARQRKMHAGDLERGRGRRLAQRLAREGLGVHAGLSGQLAEGQPS